MPGSPSPGGRKPGIRQIGQLVTRKGPEGSNPSPGAHLLESSICFKTDGCETKSKAVSVRTRRRHQIKVATSLNDIAVTALTEQEEKQVTKEEEKEDYEAFDRLIDSITRFFKERDQF